MVNVVRGKFFLKNVATSTATGRKLLVMEKSNWRCYKDREVDTYMVRWLHADTVYGDSVTRDTPLLLRNKETGNIEFMEISKLSITDGEVMMGLKLEKAITSKTTKNCR